MPTLNWIGKEKVINHHLEVPYRVLNRKYSFNINGQTEDDNGSQNMIIHGDNLEALKSLMPKFEGKICLAYIDPPYNTGKNDMWIYNDNVNDPRMKKWIGEVVGKEGEDLSRHDKWLCMMYPRLRMIQKLLKPDGCLVISISYHELQNLISICTEIFSTKQIVPVTVQTSGGKPSSGFNYLQEYLVFVVPKDVEANALDFWGGKSRSPYEGLTLSTFDKTQRPNQTYPVFIDTKTQTLAGVGLSLQEQIDTGLYEGKKRDFEYDFSVAPEGTVAIWPITTKGKQCVWRQISERLKSDWDKGYIKIIKNKGAKNGNLYSIQYLPEGVIKKVEEKKLKVLGKEKNAPTLILGKNETVGSQIPTIWTEKEYFTAKGTNELSAIFPDREKAFDYPKPVSLISTVVKALSSKDDIILDSFAGSGTTGHAVLKSNSEDDSNRTFILVEMNDYADNITAERIKRVINGYGEDNEETAGVPGDFSYFEVGEKLITEEDTLSENVSPEKLREYIWFMETHEPYENKNGSNEYYLGTSNHYDYYFYYQSNQATTLNYEFLSTIREKADGYVIYADRCTLSEDMMKKASIVFKKIPRDIAKL